jgi:uncharacterized oxidoreductase
LITGGASGIGFALAKRFANAGSRVIACGRREEQLAWAKRECPSLVTIIGDIADERGREALWDKVVKQYPDLNILINNAGIQNRPPPLREKQDWARHRLEISINLEAPVHLSVLAIPHFLKQKNAAIVNVTSGLALAPISFMPTYCLTKAALRSFTLSLRHQLKNSPIKVVELIPPAINTDLGGKGLHDQGANLDVFADHCMKMLAAGELEFGFEGSERQRVAMSAAMEPFFNLMNK